ncbi:calcium/sodium antiporter [Legionella londiniensis]|uniref:Na/Ca antiporter n=1 Tax=Legionella londiniensis TaxID=45068 RepID=A0A0W0VQD1_9GAMM|nr:calcium/sodium antiporter [Legionella londiniensis]KTD22359.1 Na/Ca antiporter [Legionella londiniensis]STX93067.1 Ca2 /Na antiporter [Legionella londiniensis]
MLLSSTAFILGLAALFWSAERFIRSAAYAAKYFHLPPLLIGMVIVGFGTSVPELAVSILAAAQGNPGIAIGNAYGSNIINIALILGLTALLSPVIVHSSVIRQELPILIGTTGLSIWLLWDMRISRLDSLLLLILFFGLICWNILQGIKKHNDALEIEVAHELAQYQLTIQQAMMWLITGLILLIISSRVLLWGAVNIAHQFGINETIIGLTIVAFGTSLPELASSIIAVQKNEHDLALGNIIGSNLFNTLAVVGFAGIISPMAVEPSVLYRDMPVMSSLTVFLFISCFSIKKPGFINRFEGLILLITYFLYTAFLIYTLF